jgi:hypothetical protein
LPLLSLFCGFESGTVRELQIGFSRHYQKGEKCMFKKQAALLCAIALLGVSALLADQWDKKTVVKFNSPVQLPGISLPSGTYVFKLADSLSNRHIVQVFNADESQLLTTILAIPNYQLEPKEETVLKFEERPSNQPDAVRAWFYPGDNFGQEFVYPKQQGTELAAREHTPVLVTEAPAAAKPEELLKAPITAAEPVKPVQQVQETPVTEAINEPPVTAHVEAAPVTPAIPVTELPKTASALPLLGLCGFGSLLLAGLLRRAAKGY